MVEIVSSRMILGPADYDVTLTFYRDVLGLPIYREYPGGTVFYAGQGLLEVAGHPVGGRQPGGPPSGALWLQVRDIAAAAAELSAAGAPINREPRTEPWGLIELWTADPDGLPIVLVEIPADHPLRRDQRVL